MNTKSRLNLSAFILGLTSMIGQILVIRELVVTFYGNELSLGIILASWLFWISFGSSMAGRLVDRVISREKLLSHIQLATSISLPLSIFLIRNIKSILNISTGKIIGFMPMLGSSFVCLSFICILLGFTFILLSRISSENSKTPSKEIGRIYLLEGLGASIGGLIYSLFLIKSLSPFQNTLILGCLNLFISLLFNRNILQILYLIALSITFIFNWPSHLERYTRTIQFRPFELIETTDSIYGNIAVTKIGEEFSFYENGLLVFTSGDSLTSEESVHYAMLEHPAPKKILLIGGGVSGSLREILKHPIEKVDYVELDPAIIKLAKKYITLPRDPRVDIVHMDGRVFVKKKYTGYGPSTSPSEKYDVIILNLPDPYTAMLNRFYSVEFFGEITKILAQDGLFSLRLSSSENYINPEQGYYLASIYNTLKKKFQDVKILPGDTATFLASNKSGMLTYDSDILIERLKKRDIKTSFVREYYLPFKLKDLRIKYIEDSLKEFGDAKINKDFRPIGYLYHTSLWISAFHSGRGILSYLEKINLNLFISVVTFLFILGFLIQRLKKTSFKIPLVLSIGTTGMSEISFQIIVILAFQFLYGYMYYRIGAILTSFMIGLVMGSFFINRLLGRIKNEISLYLKTQFFICLYPLILPFLFSYIARINLTDPYIGNRLQLSFVLLPIVAGFMGGFQFPLANKIALKNSQRKAKTTGLLYSTDLLGSCIGGLLIGMIFVPILGIIESCILLFIINTLVLILLLSNRSSD
jgi:spermidine synthase